MKKLKNYLSLSSVLLMVLTGLIFGACSSGSKYIEEGLDTTIKQYHSTPNFTILLHDQDYIDGNYQHKYEVLIPTSDSTMDKKVTNFYNVSDEFFNANIDHLGMELASKKDGVVKKSVAPAGYSQYVGNKKYGHWQERRSGGSFWEFYGKYAFMSSMFNMGTYPARHSYYNDYHRNYAPYGTTYSGPNNYYGTNSYVNSNNGRTSSWSKKPTTFRSDVRSRVQRSSTASKASRVSRSSSRYSSGSSSRSRSSSSGGK